MTTLGIAEDHYLLRKELIKIFDSSKENKVILEATNGDELINQYFSMKEKPEILIVDQIMPVTLGSEAILKIKSENINQKVIILSVVSDKMSKLNAFNIGVNAFVSKGEANHLELLKIVKSVSDNGFYLDNINFKISKKEMNWTKYGFIADFSLSHKEIEFIKYSATSLTYKEIAKEMIISYSTLKNYQESIFFKLDVTSRHSLLRKAILLGLIHIE